MVRVEITEMVKTLETERAQTRKELAKLDKVISALRELGGTNSTPSTNGVRRPLSAAARRGSPEARNRLDAFRREGCSN